MAEGHDDNLTPDGIAALARRLRDGDANAWMIFVNSFAPKAVRHFRMRGFDAHTAEDLAQETFAQAYVSIHGLRDGAKLMPWLYTIMRRTGARQRAARKSGEILMDPNEMLSPTIVRSEGALESSPHPMWNSLRLQDRELLLLRYVDGLSTSEIAQVLDSSAASIRQRLSRLEREIRDNHAPGQTPAAKTQV